MLSTPFGKRQVCSWLRNAHPKRLVDNTGFAYKDTSPGDEINQEHLEQEKSDSVMRLRFCSD